MSRNLQFTPGQPIADGIRYDDITLFNEQQQRMLVGRGMVWLTSFDGDGMAMGGTVVAGSREQADEIADARGLGETIDGVMGIAGPGEPPTQFPLWS